MSIVKRTWAEISLDNAQSNYEQIQTKVGTDTGICCVVKADGYGHGGAGLSQLYQNLGAGYFGVSNIDEGIELRNAGITKPILIFGYTPVNQVKKLNEYGFSQTVYDSEYGRQLMNACEAEHVTCKIHIKVDTGMTRIGFMCQEFPRDNGSVREIALLCKSKWLEPQGLYTHFAVADGGGEAKDFTRRQYENFVHVKQCLEQEGIRFAVLHCSNSGAIEDHAETYCNMVRAGIILYGYSPAQTVENKLDLKPVMTLKTTVAMVKEIQPGATVSYGREFTAEHAMKIATVPIGYADGYIRAYAKDGYMNINGQNAKILGRICMDQTMLDVTHIENISIGDEVTVFGNGAANSPTASDLAKWADTIEYEVVCLISKRVPRIFFKNGKQTDVMYKL